MSKTYNHLKLNVVIQLLIVCFYYYVLIIDSIKKIKKFLNFNSIDVEQPIKIFIAGAKFRNKSESESQL